MVKVSNVMLFKFLEPNKLCYFKGIIFNPTLPRNFLNTLRKRNHRLGNEIIHRLVEYGLMGLLYDGCFYFSGLFVTLRWLRIGAYRDDSKLYF